MAKLSITREDSLEYHRLKGKPGKIAVVPTKPMDTQRDLGLCRREKRETLCGIMQ